MIGVDPDRLARLDAPVPRYTSYPTVPAWGGPPAPGAWRAAVAALRAPASVYVHVPFCKEQCWFCGCNMVVAARRAAGDRYLGALERALEALPLPGDPVTIGRLHLGGGTPTWLSPEQLDRLFRLLGRRFARVAGAEVSVEVDPDVTTVEQLDVLAGHGLTRLSVGVQSFDPAVLAAIGRPQEAGRIERVVDWARARGLRGLNLDLVYGLPRQDRASLRATLDELARLRPDRVALYSYAHVPHQKPHQRRLDAAALPTPAAKARLLLDGWEQLDDRGYIGVGMDHFALPEDELAVAWAQGRLHRNFMGYTTRPDLDVLGLGMSAISEIDGVYAQQRSGLGAWYAATDRGEDGVERWCALDDDDRVRRAMIAALMCAPDVDLRAIADRHGVDFDATFPDAVAALREREADGLLHLDDGVARLTPLGRLLVRRVAAAFDAYLPAQHGFSRAV